MGISAQFIMSTNIRIVLFTLPDWGGKKESNFSFKDLKDGSHRRQRIPICITMY